MGITRDAVIWGYRFFLGRDPESEQAITDHIHVASIEDLGTALLSSEEFRNNHLFKDFLNRKIGADTPDDERPRLLIIGNCQATRMAEIAALICPSVHTTAIEVVHTALRPKLEDYIPILQEHAETAAYVYVQPYVSELLANHGVLLPNITRAVESLIYAAFHPDIAFAEYPSSGQLILGPIGRYHSALALWAYRERLGLDETVSLFNTDVFQYLGYFEFGATSLQLIENVDRLSGTQLASWVRNTDETGIFMHSVNHPNQRFLTEYLSQLLELDGLSVDRAAASYGHDRFLDGPVWPVYPPLAEVLGVRGDYIFKVPANLSCYRQPVRRLTLAEFIAASFDHYDRLAEPPRCARIDETPFTGLQVFLDTRARPHSIVPASDSLGQPAALPPEVRLELATVQTSTPYDSLSDSHYWARSVSRVAPTDVDLMVTSPRIIHPASKVASAGSCFAQHIARALQHAGQRYFVTEQGADLPANEARRRHYRTFSARYGNLYTPRQLVQLFDRAFGQWTPQEPWWDGPHGGVVDPFRPTIEPDDFASVESATQDRAKHLLAVRALFEQVDVFIFTLGLTEAWRSRLDGAVFPLVPGAHGGAFDAHRYEFVNFSYAEIVADLKGFQERLLRVNPAARVIYTVSPVALVATFESEHVAVASQASKAILRAAVRSVVRSETNCYYFPSYEMITGPWTRGAYFAADARNVNEAGVDHVMAAFRAHYMSAPQTPSRDLLESMAEVLCDEEMLDQVPSSASAPVSDPIVHLHIQKSGGSSLNELLGKAFRPARSITGDDAKIVGISAREKRYIDCYFGHMNADTLRVLPPTARPIAFLREPVSRLHSAYQYFRALHPSDAHGHALVKIAHSTSGLTGFLNDPVVQEAPDVWNHQTWTIAGESQWRDWAQTLSALQGEERRGYCEEHVAPQLRACLNRFYFVGVYEHFESDVHDLLQSIGKPINGPIPHLNRSRDIEHKDRRQDEPSQLSAESSPLTEERILEYTELDAILYREALVRR